MPTDLTGVATFHATITVPEAGDDRTASSIVPALQALLDNTTDHELRLNGLDGEDHTWTGESKFSGAGDVLLGASVEVSYEAPRARVVMISLDAYNTYGPSGFVGGGVTLQSQAASDVVIVPVHLPRDVTVTRVRVGLFNGNAASADVGHGLYRTLPNKVTPNLSTVNVLWSVSPTIAPSTNLVSDSGPLAVSIDNTASNHYVQVATTQAQTYVAWIEITYDDSGPRNG